MIFTTIYGQLYYIMMMIYDLTHTWTKWLLHERQSFQKHFIEWKYILFDKIPNIVLSLMNQVWIRYTTWYNNASDPIILTHCGLMTPCGDIGLGQHRLR